MGLLGFLGRWIDSLIPDPPPPVPDVYCPKCGIIWWYRGKGPYVFQPPPNRRVYVRQGEREFIRESCWNCRYTFERPCLDSTP